MSFTSNESGSPQNTTSSGRVAAGIDGIVSYRLARQRLVDAFIAGQRTSEELCDAQPELRRVAHGCGTLLAEACPLCSGDDLVAVAFAFGPGLPQGGRVIADLGEAKRLRKRGKPSTCYLIEVCRQCWWNHLRESFTISG